MYTENTSETTVDAKREEREWMNEVNEKSRRLKNARIYWEENRQEGFVKLRWPIVSQADNNTRNLKKMSWSLVRWHKLNINNNGIVFGNISTWFSNKSSEELFSS